MLLAVSTIDFSNAAVSATSAVSPPDSGGDGLAGAATVGAYRALNIVLKELVVLIPGMGYGIFLLPLSSATPPSGYRSHRGGRRLAS